MSSQSNIPVAEIDVSILRELMEAGNDLAAVADNNAEAIALKPRERSQLGKIIERWEAALSALCGGKGGDGMTLGQRDFRRGHRLAPGVYDYNGELHIDEAEYVRACGGDPNNPRDLETARKVLRKVAGEQGIPVDEV